MRWCARCRRRLYDESAAFCPFDGSRLEVPAGEESGSDPYLGATLQGQIHLLAAIGSGAMGTVYRAWQSGMERTVAVKLLRPDLLADRELHCRFLREGRAAARLNHPNIVSVHMVGETDGGVPYLVMEHLSGETLDQVLEAEARLPQARAIAIARQVASALAEAHAAGIVHRDLKPGNVVLLERRGAGELVKIFDFGIAKIADGTLMGGELSRLTRDGAIFGTPHYIAPEQAQGAALDGRADLYSLGVLLYRMLAGRLPFDGNAVAVLLAHIGRAPPHLARVAPHVSPPLAALVMRCLAKNPDERFATAEALIDGLDRAAAERAGAATPPIAPASPAPIAARSSRSAPRVVEAVGQVAAPRAAAPASTASDPGASWTRGWSASGEGTAAPRPVRARRAARASLAALAVVVLCTSAGTGAAKLLRRGQLGTAAAADELAAGARVERASPRAPAQQPPPPAAEAPVRRTTMVSDDGYAVRALVPSPIRAGRPVELLFDVWDPSGAPLTAPAIPVELASLGRPAPAADDADTALAARSMPETPGRYRLVAVLPAGESALLLELARGSSIHVHFDVTPAAP